MDIEVPVLADFDFFEDIDASFVAVAVAALGHVCKPLSGDSCPEISAKQTP